MAKTYFGSRVRSGSDTLTEDTNGGDVVLTQTTTATTVAAGTAVSATITLPASAQIINYIVDRTVDAVVGGGTATAIPVTIGTAAAGTQYMSSTDMITTTRVQASAPTVAQLLAMSNIGSNTSVVMTVDPDGTISTTQAVFRLTVTYRQSV